MGDNARDVLWPEQSVTVSTGEAVTVHEMTFGQTARMGDKWQPIADAVMAEIPEEPAEGGHSGAHDGAEGAAGAPGAATVYAIAERHAEALIDLIAETAKVDGESVSREWVESLPPDDGMVLAVVWISVNLRFFGVSRVGRRAAAITPESQQTEA